MYPSPEDYKYIPMLIGLFPRALVDPKFQNLNNSYLFEVNKGVEDKDMTGVEGVVE